MPEPAIQWLHECPELIAECQTFQDYCDRRAQQGDRKAGQYRSYTWMDGIFRMMKRLPGVNNFCAGVVVSVGSKWVLQ